MKGQMAVAFAAVLSAELLLHASALQAQTSVRPGGRDNSKPSTGSERSESGTKPTPTGSQPGPLADIDQIHDRLFSDRWWEREEARPRTPSRTRTPVVQPQSWRPAPRETPRPAQLPPPRLRSEARRGIEGEAVSPRTLRELRAYNSAARRRGTGAPQSSAALRFLRRSHEVLRSQPDSAHRAPAPRVSKDPLLGSLPATPAVDPVLRGTQQKPSAPPVDPLLRGTERKPARKSRPTP